MMGTAGDLELYFDGSVEEKLRVARKLYTLHGASLLASDGIRKRLRRLREAGECLAAQMTAMGMGERCGRCASRAGGGCCSAFMASNTDAILLLINLLLDNDPRPRFREEECGYLAADGCMLSVKPIFCLGYNCTWIKEAAPAGEMEELERRAAAVLSQQTELESALLSALKQLPENGKGHSG